MGGCNDAYLEICQAFLQILQAEVTKKISVVNLNGMLAACRTILHVCTPIHRNKLPSQNQRTPVHDKSKRFSDVRLYRVAYISLKMAAKLSCKN